MNSTMQIFLKEWRSELRTRFALNALFMFILTTVSIILFAIGAEEVENEVLAGVLWVVIFFSTMSGLARTFVSEEERGTVMTLQLVATPLSVYFGKLLFNVVLLALMNILAVSLYLVVLPGMIVRAPALFVANIGLGTIGLAAASTMIAALVAKANTRGTLYPVLSFPILLPLIIAVINVTKLSLENAPFIEAFDYLKMIVAYIVVLITTSYLVFPIVWKD